MLSELSMDAVVLAAGKSVRMKSETPKVLHPVAGMPMLVHVLDALRASGLLAGAPAVPVVPVVPVVVVGHGREQVQEAMAGRELRWVVQDRQLGTGHAVKVARAAVSRPAVLVLCGDTPLLRPETLSGLAEAHRASGARATVLTFRPPEVKGYGRIVRGADGGVLRIVEEADASFDEKLIAEANSGIYIFESAALFEALDGLSARNKQGEYYLTDVVALFNEAGEKVEAVEVEDASEVLGVNTRRDLAAVCAVMFRRNVERLMDAGVTVVDPYSTWVECGVEVGADTVIEPGTMLRTGVRVGRRCHVGPFTTLRGSTVLEDGAEVGNFTEVKSSTLGAGSKAKHLAYIGDATIGREVNVGAGTIFANYDGKKKHPSSVGDGSFIGSGTVLVAPVKVGKGCYTGAGSVVTRGRDVADGETVVGVPARPFRRKEDHDVSSASRDGTQEA